jgi:hypothetical protein
VIWGKRKYLKEEGEKGEKCEGKGNKKEKEVKN